MSLAGPDSSFVTVVAPYEPYAAIDRAVPWPRRGGRGEAARFVPLDCSRPTGSGSAATADALSGDHDRSRDRCGYGLSLDPSAPTLRHAHRTCAVGAATGTIELRHPWALLRTSPIPIAPRPPPGDDARAAARHGREPRVLASTRSPSIHRARSAARSPASRGRRRRAPLFTWARWERRRVHAWSRRPGSTRFAPRAGALPDRMDATCALDAVLTSSASRPPCCSRCPSRSTPRAGPARAADAGVRCRSDIRRHWRSTTTRSSTRRSERRPRAAPLGKLLLLGTRMYDEALARCDRALDGGA